MKIVRLSKDSNLNRIEKVFNWFRFSGRGPQGEPGTIGTLDLLDPKATPVDTDLILVGDSADSFANKKTTWANIKATLKAYFDTIYQPLSTALTKITEAGGLPLWDGAAWPGGTGGWSRGAHGSITVTEEFSAANTEHTASISADIGFTFADFSELQPRIRIKLTVVSGNPDVTPPAVADLSADSPQNLTNMATGVYIVEVVSFDDGTGYSYTVSHFEAGSTSSITEPILADAVIPVTFSEAQNPATVLTIGNGTGTLELFHITGGIYVPASVATSDNTIWDFTPDSNLAPGSSYQFRLKREITSLIGNRKYAGVNPDPFTPAGFVVQDYTTFTFTDPGGVITETANKLDVNGITRDADTYARKDMGVAFFDGNFTVRGGYTHISADNFAYVIPWMISNDIGAVPTVTNGLYLFGISGVGDSTITLKERGNPGASSGIILTNGVKYYYEIIRDESVGANGTLYVNFYTDSGFSVLHDSGSLALDAKTDYRYLYGIASNNTGNTNAATVDLENLSLLTV